MHLRGKVAIVTGPATGIGQGIAVSLTEEGAAVVVDYVGKPDAANTTLDTIRSSGGHVSAVEADVSNPEQVANLVGEAVKTFGKLDIVVNNAGIEKKYAFVDYPLEEAEKIINVNLIGPFLVAQAAARQMIKQRQAARIINNSSVHEDLPMPTNTPYCMSKGGLRMFARTIAVELGKYQNNREQHRAGRNLQADRCRHRSPAGTRKIIDGRNPFEPLGNRTKSLG